MLAPEMSAVSAAVKKGGPSLEASLMETVQSLIAPFHETEPYAGIKVLRDERYGEAERNRLDVFLAEGAGNERRPVLIFAHGGGFLRGDKKRPGTPYQDNVGVWAVRNGMVGINMTYRFANEFKWPSGAEDVAAAVAWAVANADRIGADPQRIYVMGTSAGATHVASYVTYAKLHENGVPPVAGAIMLSGHYDLESEPLDERLTVYFGEDDSRRAEQSPLPGLIRSPVPLLYVMSEYDPPEFGRYALSVINAHQQANGRLPNFVRLVGHNHFTGPLSLNTPEDQLARYLLSFIGSNGARGGTEA